MIYLEGTDGVGKTTTIDGLKKYGYICKDREKKVFSKNMIFEVPMDKRIAIYDKYLKTHDDIIIFLINNNGDDLMKRIYSRSKISKYDLDAPKYNELYLETFNELKNENKLYNKLYLVDCTNLNLDEQITKIKELLDKIYA